MGKNWGRKYRKYSPATANTYVTPAIVITYKQRTQQAWRNLETMCCGIILMVLSCSILLRPIGKQISLFLLVTENENPVLSGLSVISLRCGRNCGRTCHKIVKIPHPPGPYWLWRKQVLSNSNWKRTMWICVNYARTMQLTENEVHVDGSEITAQGSQVMRSPNLFMFWKVNERSSFLDTLFRTRN